MAKRAPPSPSPRLEEAGALCVAFVNTAGAKPDNGQLGVSGYAELVTWGQLVGLLSVREAKDLSRIASERPADAAASYGRAKVFRQDLARIFRALWSGQRAPAAALRGVNELLNPLTLQLVPGEGVMTSTAEASSGDELDRVLHGLVLSAYDFLRSPDAGCVRRCSGHECLLHFVDRTPTRRRRWCDRSLCGTRESSLRHYYRKIRTRRMEVQDRLKPHRARRKRPRREPEPNE